MRGSLLNGPPAQTGKLDRKTSVVNYLLTRIRRGIDQNRDVANKAGTVRGDDYCKRK